MKLQLPILLLLSHIVLLKRDLSLCSQQLQDQYRTSIHRRKKCKFSAMYHLRYCSIYLRRICGESQIFLDSVPVGAVEYFCRKCVKQRYLPPSNTAFPQRANKNNQSARLYVNKKPLKRSALAFVGLPLIRRLQASLSEATPQTKPQFS